ncbi:MAG: hypothetical protein LAT76_06585 [Schleiferiaceae bacterium]|nr:hypothetical protein [Schleiferiaceae bacterium]
MRIILFTALSLLLLSSYNTEEEDLKQRIAAFIESESENYEKKYLNIADRDIGDIEGSRFEFSDKFMLRSTEKAENNLGNKVKEKLYFSIYYYESETDRDYAMKHWTKNFIDGGQLRVGRNARSYPNATPTIIIINKQDICILNYACSFYDYDSFKSWRNKMLKFFGDPETSVVVEIRCDGPVDWTLNAPEPTDRRWK